MSGVLTILRGISGLTARTAGAVARSMEEVLTGGLRRPRDKARNALVAQQWHGQRWHEALAALEPSASGGRDPAAWSTAGSVPKDGAREEAAAGRRGRQAIGHGELRRQASGLGQVSTALGRGAGQQYGQLAQRGQQLATQVRPQKTRRKSEQG